jgi:hypothetical protein
VRLLSVVGLVVAASVALASGARADDPAVARARFRAGGADQAGGTVFFLQTPQGVAAVGAAHSFDLARLAAAPEVLFELGRSRRQVSRASRILTTPGLPFSSPGASIRDDFILFALDSPPAGVRVLHAGAPAKKGERVQLLGIPNAVPRDEDDVFGRVKAIDADRVEVELDVAYDLRGWGGAPVVSHDDGRVLGVVEAASPSGTTLLVAAAPIQAVLDAAAQPLDGGRGRAFARITPPAAKAETASAAETTAPSPEAARVVARSEPAAPPPEPPAPARTRSEPHGSARKSLLSGTEAVTPGQLILDVEYPSPDAIVGSSQGAFLAGRALAPKGRYRHIDVVFVIDTSGSTNDASGADINGNGVVGKPPLGTVGSLFGLGTSDPGDSILAAEVAAARRFLSRLDPRSTRVALVTFAGEPPEDGFVIGRRPSAPAMTEVPLTTDYEDVQRALDRVLERGPYGMTHMAAGVDQATIELLGLRGAFSKPDPESEKVVVFLTDGQPTLPYGPDMEQANIRAVLRAAERSRKAGVRVFTFGIGKEALEGPLAIVQLADITGGTFTPVRNPGTLGDIVEGVDFANLDSLTVRNVTNGNAATEVSTSPDGSWSALVPLAAGKNVIEITAHSSDGQVRTVRRQVQYAPGVPEPTLPPTLLASRNRLLEQRLVELRRARLAAEEQQAEQTRKELAVEIEKERAAAKERAEVQRKQLDIRVDDRGGAEPAPKPGS